MALKELSNEQKLAIAEFTFANISGTLIKSEAIDLLKVLRETNMITDEEAAQFIDDVQDNAAGVTEKLVEILKKNIPDNQGEKIMSDFYSGKL